MNLLINVGIFFLILGILLLIRSYLVSQSQVRFLQCKPQEISLSVLWLYRGRLIEVFLLALTISLRLIWQVDLLLLICVILISGFSMVCFTVSRNQYQKSVLFAISVALQMALWFIIGTVLTITLSHQFSITRIFYFFGWILYDFGVIYLIKKK